MCKPSLSQRGITLLELMFAIAVLAILTAVAAPGFTQLIRENRTTSFTNDLVTTFALARSESVRRSSPIAVCPSADQADCAGTDWAAGWIVFVDDGATVGSVDAGEEILQVGGPAPDGYTADSDPVEFVVFAPNGLALPAGDKSVAVRPASCAGEQVRQITVTGVGRVGTRRVAC
jgi:type IV fimbrial biogenesis protein FimT